MPVRSIATRIANKPFSRPFVMHEPFDITTVIFAVLAVFVVWKLRSVLGTRTGTERPPFDPFAARRKASDAQANAAGETGKIIRLPGADARPSEAAPVATGAGEQWADFVNPDTRAAEGLDRIKSADPSFSAAAFIEGARAAYELIVSAYASGDRNALTPLLSKDVLDSFGASIAEREAKGRKIETTFVSMDKSVIEDAQLRDRSAQITVKFQPKLITVTRDRDGAVVDGSPDQVADVTDLWTFARPIDAPDPNWKLVATETIS